MNNNAISNEEIITALLESGTIKEAAALVGLSSRAIYDRMNDGEFQALYKRAKADILRASVVAINEYIGESIRTIAQIMNNEKNNPAVRLQAAQTLLNNAAKFTQRLTEAEEVANKQANNNKTAALLNSYIGG